MRAITKRTWQIKYDVENSYLVSIYTYRWYTSDDVGTSKDDDKSAEGVIKYVGN